MPVTVAPAAVDVARMRRVVAVGAYGAGKTTLARELGEALGLTVHHLDALRWQPGWQLLPFREWCDLSEQLVAGEDWIVDGNFERTLDIRLARAQTVLFLDAPVRVSLVRVLRRRLRHEPRPDLAPGCVETPNLRMLRLLWDYRRTVRPQLVELLRTRADHCQVVVLRSSGDVDALLARVGHARPRSSANRSRVPT